MSRCQTHCVHSLSADLDQVSGSRVQTMIARSSGSVPCRTVSSAPGCGFEADKGPYWHCVANRTSRLVLRAQHQLSFRICLLAVIERRSQQLTYCCEFMHHDAVSSNFQPSGQSALSHLNSALCTRADQRRNDPRFLEGAQMLK